MPEARAAAVATAKAFRLPSPIEQLFRPMISNRLLREVIPVFARAAKGRPRALSGKLAGGAFATSVRESDADDMARAPGIEYAHRVPARWLARAKPTAASADPLVNRQW